MTDTPTVISLLQLAHVVDILDEETKRRFLLVLYSNMDGNTIVAMNAILKENGIHLPIIDDDEL